MITITTETVCEYLKMRFPEISDLVRNGNINKSTPKSVGVFSGSNTRLGGNLAIGGLDCTVTRHIPISIKIRGTENQKEHDALSVDIYNKMLTETDNFMVDNVKIAYIELIDPCPQSIGRDEKNVCESVIRANFHYYV